MHADVSAIEGDPIVHVVDDDAGVRAALHLALTIAGYSVRLHKSARAFLRALGPDEYGCVIADIRMPDMRELELLAAMKARDLALPAIVVTAYGEITLAVEAMKLGAVDFLEKPFVNLAVVEAVAAALDRPRSKGRRDDETQLSEARVATLTPRERDVLSGLMKGQQNKVIGRQLGISPRTVEIHRASIMEKMKAGNLRELMRMVLFVAGEE